MKNKHFYSYLVETTHITLDLGGLDLTPEERVHLLALIEANIHSSVVKTVLENLDSDNKKIFLKNLVENDHNIVWEHLKINIKNSEGVIRQAIEETIKDLRKDIRGLVIQDK